MNKRVLRKFAESGRKLNLRSGIFLADQVKYIVCTAVHNIAGRRTLVLYVYAKESMSAGDYLPQWTMFQTTDEYLTLFRDEKGSRWQTSMFQHLDKEWNFAGQCAFYSFADEQRVCRFCKMLDKKGFSSLHELQSRLFYKRQNENKRKKEREIIDRMKAVGALPRDIKGFMRRETLPQYIFYDYQKRKTVNGYCTACKHEVEVKEAHHNKKGVCPRCKKPVTFKSRGKRGHIIDRSTAQVIQRTGESEIVVRFMKTYCCYPKQDTPRFTVYENARLFLRWEDGRLTGYEPYYWSYTCGALTPWHKGERPVFCRWLYNFEADGCGYLYHRNLDEVLRGTPFQYSALKEYYLADPEPLYVARYLKEYLRYPMLEYLVKLRLYRLATYVAYGENGCAFYGNEILNKYGKNITEVLGIGKRYLPFLQEVNPGRQQLKLIRDLIREHIQPNQQLLKWCTKYNVGDKEQLITLLRFMTPHKLMRYATEQFETHRKTSYASPGYYSMSYLLSDYVDYLAMSDALDYDMKNSFVLFPRDLKEAHDRVNDMSDTELSEVYDRKVAKDFPRLERKYRFSGMGLVVIPPHSAKEIVAEGQKLHHCVGRYVKNVVCGKCVILFIRRLEAPDEPFCTVELRNDAVTQARINNNDNPPLKVQKFMELWKQQVLCVSADAAA